VLNASESSGSNAVAAHFAVENLVYAANANADPGQGAHFFIFATVSGSTVVDLNCA
jgi:hypothetical protein